MARWTDPIRLRDYESHRHKLLVPGVYEIGFYLQEEFNPKYLGKASDKIYTRIYRHYNQYGNRGVAEYYYEKEQRESRDMLYFHFINTLNFDAMERNLLDRYGIGKDGGLYEWNNRYESGEE